jgi:hypothetical protein
METKFKLEDLVYELNTKEQIKKTDKLLVVVNGVVDDGFLADHLFLSLEKRATNIKGYSVLQHFSLVDGFFVSGTDKISLYNEDTKEHILFIGTRPPMIQMSDITASEKFIDKCLQLLTKLKEDAKKEEENTGMGTEEPETVEEIIEDSDTDDGGIEDEETVIEEDVQPIIEENEVVQEIIEQEDSIKQEESEDKSDEGEEKIDVNLLP